MNHAQSQVLVADILRLFRSAVPPEVIAQKLHLHEGVILHILATGVPPITQLQPAWSDAVGNKVDLVKLHST